MIRGLGFGHLESRILALGLLLSIRDTGRPRILQQSIYGILNLPYLSLQSKN